MRLKIRKMITVFTVMLVTITSFGLNPTIKVKALASISGDRIIQQAQTYANWDYYSIGTCTGFATRVLDDLGIADSIVGSMVGTSARYTPDQMYANAIANPQDAKLIWQGNVSNINSVASSLKNGDLVLQLASDKSPYDGFGHVGFIRKYGSTISMYGANNPVNGVSDAILSTNARGSDITVDGKNVVRIFRIAEDIKPSYSTLTSTKNATENVNVSLKKTDVDTGKVLSDVEFDFYRDGVKFNSVKTDVNGIATVNFSKTYSSTSAVKKYCTNYDQLDPNGKQQVANAGAFAYKSQAQTSADTEAQASANAQANQNHKYMAVETKTKTKYYLDASNSSTSSDIIGSGKVDMNLSNKRVVGTLNLIKTDSETGKSEAQGDATLEGAVYGLYARENIFDPADNSVLYSKNSLVHTMNLKNAKASVNSLYLGKYYVKEIKAPTGYNLDTREYDIELGYAGQNQSVVEKTITVKEDVIKSKIRIAKKDIDTNKIVKREGFKFDVYFHDGTLVDSIETNKDGYATSKDLPYGSYFFKEKSSGSHYVVDVDTKIDFIVVNHNEIINREFKNPRVNATINITKIDTDTTKIIAQGDATLEGAVYGLYARNNILDPSNDGTVLFQKDTLVEKVTIKDSKAVVKNLYLGDYYWKEIKAPVGYKLDAREYDVTPTWEGENTITVNRSNIVKQDIITGDFDLEKVITSGEQSEIVTKEEGAEFLVVLKKYVTKYGSIEKAYEHRNEYTEKEFDKLITDKNGYDKTNPLAFGTYVIKQVKGKIDTDKLEAEWEFKVSHENQETIRYIINNRPFTSYLKVIKKDVETGKTIITDNATFKIFDKNKNKYLTQKVGDKVLSEFKTNDKGYVVLPLQLKAGNYRLEEIKAPHNYLLNTKSVDFKITNTVIGEVDDEGDPIQIIEFTDKAVKGQIEIKKEGEVLTSSKTDRRGKVHFGYTTKGIQGMEVDVVAASDILDPADNSVLFKEGEVVEKLITDKKGAVKTSKLPLGKYYVIETKAPEGFTIREEKKYVELKYKDDKTSLISKSETIENERQKIDIKLVKKDFDDDTALTGAIFGLYATNDIADTNGNVLVTKDSLIESEVSNEDGMINFEADLPLGEYQIKEIKAPIGYASSNEVINVDATYKDQNIDVIEISKEFKNQITKVEISKTDITTDKELAGNHLTIYEKDNEGNVFDTWISSDKAHLIKGLEVGKTYVLHETSSSYGFSKAKDIEFKIEDTGKIQKVKMENKLVEGKLVFNKQGKIFTRTDIGQTEVGMVQMPVWETSNLLGAEITLYAAENIVLGNDITYFDKDEAIQTLESDWDDVESQLLPVGKYYYVETKAPIGYVQNDEKHYFEIEDNQNDEIQTVKSTLDNQRPTYQLNFKKELEINVNENIDAYKDVVFGIFTRDDTYSYMGEVAIDPDTLIYTSGIDFDGSLTNEFELPVGNYYLKELATNEAYTIDENEYDFTIDQSNDKKVNVEINDGNSIINKLKDFEITINKTDSKSKKNILNKEFEFTRYADKECKKVIDKAIINKDEGSALFNNLHYGITYVKETKEPKGYDISDDVIKIEVNNEGVFINDKLIDTIDFENELTPVIPTSTDTSDQTNVSIYILLGLGSLLALFGLKSKSKTKELK